VAKSVPVFLHVVKTSRGSMVHSLRVLVVLPFFILGVLIGRAEYEIVYNNISDDLSVAAYLCCLYSK